VNYILLDDEDFCHYLQNSTENFGAIKKYIQNKKEKQKILLPATPSFGF